MPLKTCFLCRRIGTNYFDLVPGASEKIWQCRSIEECGKRIDNEIKGEVSNEH